MILLKILLGVLLLCAIALVAGSFFFYFTILFRNSEQSYDATPETTQPHNAPAHREQAQKGLDTLASLQREELSITSFDGLTLRGHLYPVAGAKRTFLLVHGYRSCGYHDFNAQAVFYHQVLKGNVLIIEQRAHGCSDGKKIAFGVLERFDIKQWAELLASRFPDTDLYLNGISMGCGTVTMASELPLPENTRGIIADCGYTSVWDEFCYVLRRDYHLPVYPLLPMAELVTKMLAHWDFHTVSPRNALKNTKLPILFLHGTKDDFVPTRMGEENYAACTSEKELLLIDGAQHAESYFVDTPRVEAAITAFVEKHAVLSK